MSLSLADLAADRRTITVTYRGHDVAFTYQPSLYTAELAALLHTIPTTEFVALLVSEWDVLDDEGNKLPVNAETVATLPMKFLGAVGVAIMGDTDLGEAESS